MILTWATSETVGFSETDVQSRLSFLKVASDACPSSAKQVGEAMFQRTPPPQQKAPETHFQLRFQLSTRRAEELPVFACLISSQR